MTETSVRSTPLQTQLNRLQHHMLSPPSKAELLSNIESGRWPGLEIKRVTLPVSGCDIGLGVFASDSFPAGYPISHYPSSSHVTKDEYSNLPYDPNVANYAQEISTSGIVDWPRGPIVLLAHNIPVNAHYGHLINHSPCQSCRNVSQTVQMIGSRPQLIFRARRHIKKNDQLLRDYGEQYVWPNQKVECPACGSVKETGPKVYT